MSTFIIGAAAVIRTLAVVALGGFSVLLLEDSGATNSWFSVMNIYVFLPCLLLGHFATTFSVQVFTEGFPLVVFGFSRIFIGAGATKLAALFGLFDEETQPLALLATSSSNAIAIPLAVMSELVTRVDFLSADPKNDVRDAVTGKMVTAEQYVETLMFVYAIPINFSIWSIGQFYIRNAAERKKHEMDVLAAKEKAEHEAQELADKEKQQTLEASEFRNDDNDDDDDIVPVASPAITISSPQTIIRPFHVLQQQQQQNKDNKDMKLSEQSISTKKAHEDEEEHEGNFANTLYEIFRVYIIRSLSVPLVCSLAGIGVALIPGVQQGITGGWPLVTSATDSIILLGSAAVPAALITVGITIFRTLMGGGGGSKLKKHKKTSSHETNPDLDDSAVESETSSTVSTSSGGVAAVITSVSDKITNLLGISASLVLSVSFLQLVITPLVGFFVITKIIFRNDFDMIQHSATNGIFDLTVSSVETAEYWRKRRLMLFSLLCESMCPSAMNTAIICNFYNYRSEDFSRIIVYQYILSVFSMSLLLSLYLSTFEAQ